MSAGEGEVPRWGPVELSDEEKRAELVRLGIDPDLANRHLVRKLYPWIRGVERATDEDVLHLIDGAIERCVDQRRRYEERVERLRRNLPWILLGALAVLALFVFVVVPDLVFL